MIYFFTLDENSKNQQNTCCSHVTVRIFSELFVPKQVCRQQLVFCFLFRRGWHVIGVVTHFPSTFLVGQIQNISMHLKILNWNRVQNHLGNLLRQLEAVFLLDTGWYLVDKGEMFIFDSEDLLLHVAQVFLFLGCEMPGSLPEDLRSWRDMCLAQGEMEFLKVSEGCAWKHFTVSMH